MKFKTMLQVGLVTGLAATLAVACAPKNRSNPGKKVPGAQQQKEAITKTLVAVFGDKYDPKAQHNREFAEKIIGLTLDLEQLAEDKKSANVRFHVLLADRAEPISAHGTLTVAPKDSKDAELAVLTLEPDHCNKQIESIVIQGRCFGTSCSQVAIIVSEKLRVSNQENAFRSAAMIFTMAQTKAKDSEQAANNYKVEWSAGKDGEKSGAKIGAEEALKAREEKVRKGELAEVRPASCDADGVGTGTDTGAGTTGTVQTPPPAAGTPDAQGTNSTTTGSGQTGTGATTGATAGGTATGGTAAGATAAPGAGQTGGQPAAGSNAQGAGTQGTGTQGAGAQGTSTQGAGAAQP